MRRLTTSTYISGPKAIIVVDDETDIVYIFRKSLELTGYTVFAFTNPLLAFDHFKGNLGRYGLIITDVRMLIISGV